MVNFFAEGFSASFGVWKDVTDGCKILGGSVICGYKLVDELLLK